MAPPKEHLSRNGSKHAIKWATKYKLEMIYLGSWMYEHTSQPTTRFSNDLVLSTRSSFGIDAS